MRQVPAVLADGLNGVNDQRRLGQAFVSTGGSLPALTCSASIGASLKRAGAATVTCFSTILVLRTSLVASTTLVWTTCFFDRLLDDDGLLDDLRSRLRGGEPAPHRMLPGLIPSASRRVILSTDICFLLVWVSNGCGLR